jgi:FtsZ-interacting cell division protein ZipA
MDFIKKLISGILGFVGGILGLVTGLLPGKKKSNGYFLELEEATSQSKPAESNGKKAQEAVAVAAPAASQTAKSSEPESVKATKAPKKAKVEASQNGKAAKAAATTKTPTETTFAPKYLAPSITSSNGRRRPGANMSAYLEMARQVKTPNN